MASTDTRSGFRLPWSSDRSHDEAAPATQTPETPADEAAPANGAAGPSEGSADPLGSPLAEPRPADENQSPATAPEEPEPMVDMDTAVVTAPAAAPKKPSKLMADLTAAIRATAEAAREQSLAQVLDDVQTVTGQIRERSTDGAAALRSQSEDDITAIREWSEAEIARIHAETESRIETRKAALDDELAGHAAAVERRVAAVEAEVTRFETAMAAYLERLGTEDDPARLATMAEEMPEPPSLDAWADLDTLDISLESAPAMESISEPWATPEPEVVEELVTSSAEPTWEVDEAVEAEAVSEHVEAVFAEFAPIESIEVPLVEPEPVTEVEAVVEASAEETPDEPVAGTTGDNPWTGDPNAWGAMPSTTQVGSGHDWATAPDAGASDAFPANDGSPASQGSIMAALEAEAMVVAEASAESTFGAEATTDAAMDSGGFDTESFANRLASLLPTQGEGSNDSEQHTTQVVVSGLVSVASIASFKRHLGRLDGVQTVAVASGPEGEFVFNLTHRADVSFRDAIPSMPGFAARVTNTGDGVVNVTARDPEAEA